MTLQDKLKQIHSWLREDAELWHILTAARGPDSPSERPSDTPEQSRTAYAARRERKRRTVEVIRGKAFPGVGAARFRTDIDYVTLPPSRDWDHFDKHVALAARALGLKVKEDASLALRRD